MTDHPVSPTQADIALADVIVKSVSKPGVVVTASFVRELQDALARHRLAAIAPAGVAEDIPAGMKPWHGGESAPSDWDGGPVLLRDGQVLTHPFWDWSKEGPDEGCDIIAYTPLSAAPSSPLAGVLDRETVARIIAPRVSPTQALTVIANWPITDPENQDAVNMALVAKNGLTTAPSSAAVEEAKPHGAAWSDDRLGQAYQLIDEVYQGWPSESGPSEALRAAREAVEAADMEIPE